MPYGDEGGSPLLLEECPKSKSDTVTAKSLQKLASLPPSKLANTFCKWGMAQGLWVVFLAIRTCWIMRQYFSYRVGWRVV